MSDAAMQQNVRAWFQVADGLRTFHGLVRLAEKLGAGRYEVRLLNQETGAMVCAEMRVSADTGLAEMIIESAQPTMAPTA